MITKHKGAQPSTRSSLGALTLITSTASSSLFLQLFSAYPILEQPSTHLSIADIVALTRTHRELINVYKDLEANRWKIDQTLRRFVSNAARFRSQMAKYNALVFGSIPLQFFERVVWEESDMDILRHGKKDADAFGTYLSTLEGYKFHHCKNMEEYNLPDRLEASNYPVACVCGMLTLMFRSRLMSSGSSWMVLLRRKLRLFKQ